jgi:tetratricopeptide (TPR) repeat protein
MGAASNHRDPDILNGLGITLCEMGRLHESRQVLKIAVDITPDDAITLANMAGVLWEMNDYEEAIHFYRKSLEADPEIEETHYNLINLYMETGSLFMAFIHCQDLINMNGESEEAREMMEDIILNLGISIF